MSTTAVLVLDVGMQPLRVDSWQRAFCDVLLGKCEVIEYSRDRTIRSASRVWPMPSVVRLTRYFKRDRQRIKFSRINIYARDNFTCQYCGTRHVTEDLTIDHVTPRSKGGKTTWENVVASCQRCNRDKADKSVSEAGLKLLNIPKKPHNLPHICVPFDRKAPPEWANYWRVSLQP